MELNVNLFIKLTSEIHCIRYFTHSILVYTCACVCVYMRCLPLTDGFDIWICEASAMRLFTWIHTPYLLIHSFIHTFNIISYPWSDCVRPYNILEKDKKYPIIKLDFKRASVTRLVRICETLWYEETKWSKKKTHIHTLSTNKKKNLPRKM